MKITRIIIHNYRSIIDADLKIDDSTLLVGANNAGKSNVINAIRAFYDDLRWTNADFPKSDAIDDSAWVKIYFSLTDSEWNNLADDYKNENNPNTLILIRRFKGEKAKSTQSNIYAIVDEVENEKLFYGAKNVGIAKAGEVIYVPAISLSSDQMKTSGPSPFRETINTLFKKVVSQSTAYEKLVNAFEDLNTEVSVNSDGAFFEISEEINRSLSDWEIRLQLNINPIKFEDITKSLVQTSFFDEKLGSEIELRNYGEGFQRSLIYEIIKIAASQKEVKESSKKEFSSETKILLFEEPEAFLHPSQQELMAYNLRKLAEMDDWQVIMTTHSPTFISKNNDQINQIIKVEKESCVSEFYQLDKNSQRYLTSAGIDFIDEIQAFVNDSNIAAADKSKAKQMLRGDISDDSAAQFDRFRYQMWLDTEKASMFFADLVLLVEGATERALFNLLLSDRWNDLAKKRILVVNMLGKYNAHRYMRLLEAFGIKHGVILDDDNQEKHHGVINMFMESHKNEFTVADIKFFGGCLEDFLGIVEDKRSDRKPLSVLKALEDGDIPDKKLDELKTLFCEALAL
ncbi:MAG TPA: AAA family ATPase [Candidatus Cloacimonetes bacterium]|nr:AAA family ATPase [Candidatus Cloacimonadota bacterium]